MNCLLVILMSMERYNYPNGRLVVMELGDQAKLYHTYRLVETKQFRLVKTESDIFMAASPIEQAGTYLTIYCSPFRSVRSLEKYIVKDTVKLTTNSVISFHQSVTSEENCLNELRFGFELLRRKSLSSGKIELNAHPYVEDGRCTESSIYCLALQGEISLHAKYNIDIEQQWEKTIMVRYPNGLRMASIALDGQFLQIKETHQQDFGLAWYQGYLEVFVKAPSSNVWSLKRTESSGIPNHRPIIDLVAQGFQGVTAVIEALNRLKEKNKEIVGLGDYSKSISEFKLLLANFGKDGKRFNPVHATGFFGAEPALYAVSS